MVKILLISIFLFFSFSAMAESEFDKDIVVVNQSRSDKVKSVFKQLMNYYEEEDEQGFFSLVSEDRFIQDYMLFSEAIEKDFRDYDILSFDYWIDKITDDGIKRYLYVKWEKRYESANSTTEKTKTGYSRFLFDEINGQYKLIELAGNTLWGDSLPEWKEEVPQIPGQETEDENISEEPTPYEEVTPPEDTTPPEDVTLLPDLNIAISECVNGVIYFDIGNIGEGSTTAGSIEYNILDVTGSGISGTYDGDLSPNEKVSLEQEVGDCNYVTGAEVDPNNLIEESDENNNIDNL